LFGTEPSQHRDRASVETDEMAKLRLRNVLHDHLVIDHRHRSRDHGGAGVEVDIGPLEPEAFAAPAA
jgi:hypothetical protein